MTIAFDADDMTSVRERLDDAADGLRGALPPMPGGAAFGPAVLGAAVADFESAVRRDAEGLRERWSGLSTAVAETLADMDGAEAGFIDDLATLREPLS